MHDPRDGNGTNPLIRRLEHFGALTAEDRAILSEFCADPFAVGARTEIAQDGARPTGAFVLLDGMACRSKLRADGTRQILAYLVPGDFCDLDGALLDRRDHAIAALSSCRVARIGFDAIRDLTAARSALIPLMRRASLVDDAILREWLINLGSRSAIERIAHLFLELLMRLRAVGLARADGYDLPASQVDLADSTGLSTVHVNRTLQELKRRGLIEMRSRILQIRNVPGLTSLSGFDPRYLAPGPTVGR
ncbi:Crp/Fnr family transcriptional regulator [Methylobacterium goesingense]|nr:Crp/Fnr family transcriptional regulator [Methylobacterium goesingense]